MKLRKQLAFLLLLMAGIGTTTLVSCKKELCSDTCPFNNDGTCDDGGEGAVYNLCDEGTDCADCGPRER